MIIRDLPLLLLCLLLVLPFHLHLSFPAAAPCLPHLSRLDRSQRPSRRRCRRPATAAQAVRLGVLLRAKVLLVSVQAVFVRNDALLDGRVEGLGVGWELGGEGSPEGRYEARRGRRSRRTEMRVVRRPSRRLREVEGPHAVLLLCIAVALFSRGSNLVDRI